MSAVGPPQGTRPLGETARSDARGHPIKPDEAITRPIPPARLWWLAAGFGVWCIALAILYALHAIGCVFAWPTGTLRVSLVLVLLANLIAIGWMWRLATVVTDPIYGQPGAFLHEVVLWTLITAFIATALTLGPPLLLATCV